MAQSPAKKLAFVSGKGGVGKSTLVCTIGQKLYEMGKKILLIDCDVALKSLDIMLSLSDKTVYDWNDVLQQRCSPDDALVSQDGPALLTSPAYAVDVTGEQMKTLIENYENDFDYILIDAPAGLDGGFDLAVAMADRAVVVSTPDAICVRSVYKASQKLYDMGFEPRLIINRFKKQEVKKKNFLNIDQVIDETGARLLGVVPEDEVLALDTQHGQKIAFYIKSAPAIERIAKRICGEKVALMID